MIRGPILVISAIWMVALLVTPSGAQAHKLRAKGEAVQVADTPLTIIPGRDWNRLDMRMGKQTESWTLDGEQLNDVTFYAGIEPGTPLVRERSKKREPLPKFSSSTLLVEVPELLETTYRSYKQIAAFRILDVSPSRFLERDGVVFSYEFVDQDELTRRGEAYAAIIGDRLYMISFDAPRLHYYERGIADFRTLAGSARLP